MAGTSQHLRPPLFDKDRVADFVKSKQTLFSSFSPRDESLAIFPTSSVDPHTLGKDHARTSHLYTAIEQEPPSAERRTFLTDCFKIWAALLDLVTSARAEGMTIHQDDLTVSCVRKLALDYVNFCKECWVFCSQNITRPEPLQFNVDHYRKLYTCFSLFTVLYLPETGFQNAPVGEDLMDWLNTHFIEPSTEEGDHLSTLEKPWEDENFWPYLSRTILRGLSKASGFFVDALSKHPSPHLQKVSQQLLPLVTDHPRFTQFSFERDFAIASRRWKDRVKALRVELDRIPVDVREDEFDNWWDRVSDIVGILEGRAAIIKRLCYNLGADWKEVCVVWGVYIDPRIRREDLPDIVQNILDDMPSDITDLEDAVYSALLLGRPTQALVDAGRLDIWLATHLADFLDALDLIEREPDDSDLSLREQYTISYSEYLHSDPGLWRTTVDYLYSCGDIGKEMADQVLMRVPLRLQRSQKKGTNEDSANIRSEDVTGVLEEVNKTCKDYKREDVRRMVCRIASQTFMREKEYPLAVSYSMSAEDWPGLGRVVDCILEDYVAQGPQPFSRRVADIAPSLHQLQAKSVLKQNGVFIYRLIFAVRFAEFHEHSARGEFHEAAADIVEIFQQDIAPKLWWAVVLLDTVELLQKDDLMFTAREASLLIQKLEEITVGTMQGAGSDYLPILVRMLKNGDEAKALQRLQIVRLALARYYAKCGVIVSGEVQ